MIQIGDNLIFHTRSNFDLSHDLHFLLSSGQGQILTYKRISVSNSRLVTFDERSTPDMAPEVKATVWTLGRKGQVVLAQCLLSVSTQTQNVSFQIIRLFLQT